MEREIKRLVGAFGVAGFLAAVATGVASRMTAETTLLWSGLATVCGMVLGALVAWIVWRS